MSRFAVLALMAGAAFLSPEASDAADAPAAPERVVSMNLCTDQLAMLIADEGQLLSVSSLASDPRSSAMVEAAEGYPVNYGRAEEIYLLRPDLVLAGSFTARASVDMLRRLGITVETFEPAYSIADVSDRMLQMGAALGRQEQAREMVAEFKAELAGFRAEIAHHPRAAIYHANGYTAGDKTLAGEILTTAGFENIAAKAGFSAAGFLPLEVLAMAQPDTVISSTPYPGGSRSEEIMDHPVIDALRRTRPEASLTDHDWVCGTPFVLRAIQDMVELRHEVKGAAP